MKRMNCLLSQLLEGRRYDQSGQLDANITGLCLDSRRLEPGDLFFAYPGTQLDGRNFFAEVIRKGAAAILFEQKDGVSPNDARIPCIPVPNLAEKMGSIAAKFYAEPSQKLSVVGITGTNGKTSCAHFLAQCLQYLRPSCGVLGTLGNGLYGNLQASTLTTPDALDLQRWFAEFLAEKAKTVVMEVSSHRLAQHQLTGTKFAVAAFTNLTRDHLDYHRTMAAYAKAKRSLFSLPGVQQVVLNIDDTYGWKWCSELTGKLPVLAYSIDRDAAKLGKVSAVGVRHYEFTRKGLQADIVTPWGDMTIENACLLGKFNLSNLLLVVTVLKLLGFSLSEIAKALPQIKNVPGRLELIQVPDKPRVIVDYAHTPDALQQVLQILRGCCQGKIYCVFGCGGDRDQGKRALMGSIAERYADSLILTNDNPRFEDPQRIIAGIKKGLSGAKPEYIEPLRDKAIAYAIEHAKQTDMVLIAGKGHESYQLIAGTKYPFCDATEVKRCLGLYTHDT